MACLYGLCSHPLWLGLDEMAGMADPSSVWLSPPFIFIYTYRTCTACCRTSISTCTHPGLKWVEVLVPVLLERKGEGQGSCLRQPGSHDARRPIHKSGNLLSASFMTTLALLPQQSWVEISIRIAPKHYNVHEKVQIYDLTEILYQRYHVILISISIHMIESWNISHCYQI